MPGTLRGVDPVATMISLRARSVCLSPSKTSTPPLPVSRAVPLIQSILFFLKRNSTPFVSPPTMRSFRACTCAMSMPIGPVRAGHAPFLRVLHDLERVRVLEQRLGRNAAPYQARPAERLLLLDDRDRETELRGPDGGDVAARPCADHDDVVFLHGLSLQRRQRDKIPGRACAGSCASFTPGFPARRQVARDG